VVQPAFGRFPGRFEFLDLNRRERPGAGRLCRYRSQAPYKERHVERLVVVVSTPLRLLFEFGDHARPASGQRRQRQVSLLQRSTT
jgi:hypothetical protein